MFGPPCVYFLAPPLPGAGEISEVCAADDRGKKPLAAYVSTLPVPKPRENWKALHVGWVKLNTDASFCPPTGVASLGIIARGHDGQVILSSWKYLPTAASAKEAEILACLEGLRLCAEWIRTLTMFMPSERQQQTDRWSRVPF
jgi:hypothetical protein